MHCCYTATRFRDDGRGEVLRSIVIPQGNRPVRDLLNSLAHLKQPLNTVSLYRGRSLIPLRGSGMTVERKSYALLLYRYAVQG